MAKTIFDGFPIENLYKLKKNPEPVFSGYISSFLTKRGAT
jgi:hypothetical protein